MAMTDVNAIEEHPNMASDYGKVLQTLGQPLSQGQDHRQRHCALEVHSKQTVLNVLMPRRLETLETLTRSKDKEDESLEELLFAIYHSFTGHMDYRASTPRTEYDSDRDSTCP